MTETTADTVTTSTRKTLVLARALYAENPSHAPAGTYTRHCPVVCIDRAGGWDDKAQRALGDAAGLTFDAPGGVRMAIIRWNAAATTEEVLAAFDRAIGGPE